MRELFLNLLDMSLAATWLIAAVILVRLLLKKAPKWIRCLLWVLVAVRLICPFSLESKLSLVPETDPVIPSIAEAYVPDTPIQVPAVSPEQTRPADTVQNSAVIVETPTVETVNYLEVAVIIWLVGMAALLLYALISYLRLRRRVAASMLLHENIRLCDGIDSPFILGIFRPQVYLPSTVTREDMTYVLAHERAHLARRDHWWKPLGFMLLAVYWFNPLVWVAYILLCRDIELACDEKVIREMGDGEKKAYSEALLSCSVPRRMIAACPLAFGEVGVKSRIKSVLNYKKPAFWIIAVAVVACVVVAVCFLTDPVKPTVYDVEKQNGFGITAIEENVGMRVNIPTDVLNENIYSHEPYVYEEGEVVLWQTDTTTLWLESAGWCNGEEKDIVFDCQFSYTIPDQGTIRVIGRPNIQDGVTVSSMLGEGVRSKDASDSRTTYPDTVWFRGSNWGIQLCVAVDADVVRSASDYISFVVGGLTDITYEKGPANHEKDIAVILGTTVRAVEEFDYYRNPNNMPGIGHGSIVGGNMGYEIEYETGTHSLEQGTCKLSVIKNGETKIISQGKLLWNLYCADLNGDEVRELCATVGDSTDRSDTAVIVYDPISEKTYRLNAPDGSYALSAYEAGEDKILQIERTYTDSGARYVGDLRFDENGTLRMSNIQPYDISAVGGADKPKDVTEESGNLPQSVALSGFLITNGSTGEQIELTDSAQVAELDKLLEQVTYQTKVEVEGPENARVGYRFAIRAVNENGEISDALCVNDGYVQIGGKVGYNVENTAPLIEYLEGYFLHASLTVVQQKEDLSEEVFAVTGQVADELLVLLNSFHYDKETCDGIPEYRITSSDQVVFYLNLSSGWAWRNDRECEISDEAAAELLALLTSQQTEASLIVHTKEDLERMAEQTRIDPWFKIPAPEDGDPGLILTPPEVSDPEFHIGYL